MFEGYNEYFYQECESILKELKEQLRQGVINIAEYHEERKNIIRSYA